MSHYILMPELDLQFKCLFRLLVSCFKENVKQQPPLHEECHFFVFENCGGFLISPPPSPTKYFNNFYFKQTPVFLFKITIFRNNRLQLLFNHFFIQPNRMLYVAIEANNKILRARFSSTGINLSRTIKQKRKKTKNLIILYKYTFKYLVCPNPH